MLGFTLARSKDHVLAGASATQEGEEHATRRRVAASRPPRTGRGRAGSTAGPADWLLRLSWAGIAPLSLSPLSPAQSFSRWARGSQAQARGTEAACRRARMTSRHGRLAPPPLLLEAWSRAPPLSGTAFSLSPPFPLPSPTPSRPAR